MTELIPIDGKLLRAKNYATLQEAVYWLAGGIHPVHPADCIFLKSKIAQLKTPAIEVATQDLIYGLMRGHIIAQGLPCDIIDSHGRLGPRIDNVGKETPIHPSRWEPSLIAIEKSELKTHYSSKGFAQIRIQLTNLKRTQAIESDSSSKKTRGCKKEIVAEFNARAEAGKLAKLWEEEISYLCKFSGKFGHPYDVKSMKNVIKRGLYLSKIKSSI